MTKRDDSIDRRIELVGKPQCQANRHAHAHIIDQFIDGGIEEADGVTKQLQRVRQGLKGNSGLICLVRKIGFPGMSSLRSFRRRNSLNPITGLPTSNPLDRRAIEILGTKIIISKLTIQVGHGEGHARRTIPLVSRFDRGAVDQTLDCYHEPATSRISARFDSRESPSAIGSK
ncbi:hypothetical protein D3C71_1566880 [compost metagenome]